MLKKAIDKLRNLIAMLFVMSTDSLDFLDLNELASENNGGKIIFATDDWFANAENLLKDAEPVWKEGIYTEFGKWMDGWETRRKRCPGHDWLIIALKYPSIIKGCCIDTAYFTGNYAPRISIQAARLDENDVELFPARNGAIGTAASCETMKKMEKLKTEEWTTIIPMSNLGAGYPSTQKTYLNITSAEPWTHLRLNIYPDGGIARLRVYGIIIPHQSCLTEKIDLISRENGGVCHKYSNAHYGHPRNLIKRNDAINMADGWETARRLDRPPIIQIDNITGILQVPGNEWAIFKLGHTGLVDTIAIDTRHFRGNYPDNIEIKGLTSNKQNVNVADDECWKILLPLKKLEPHKLHIFKSTDLLWCGPMTHIKITISPDGGLSRLRLWGHIASSSHLPTD